MCAGGINGGVIPPEIRVMLAASLLAPDPTSFGMATVTGAESLLSWALICVLKHWGDLWLSMTGSKQCVSLWEG
jgi:hypothetical protein